MRLSRPSSFRRRPESRRRCWSVKGILALLVCAWQVEVTAFIVIPAPARMAFYKPLDSGLRRNDDGAVGYGFACLPQAGEGRNPGSDAGVLKGIPVLPACA